ncbi:MAG: hypothetical protein V3S21_09190, partial [Xanthomonadales bacterium]
AELVDALASGVSEHYLVEVKLLSWAPSIYNNNNAGFAADEKEKIEAPLAGLFFSHMSRIK